VAGETEYGRVVHCKREPYDILIDRTTAWGNPFMLGRDGDRDQVIAEYLEWVVLNEGRTATWIREHVHELRGKTLGCWCAPQACHGDILLALANQKAPFND
jgi:hypothetical protein